VEKQHSTPVIPNPRGSSFSSARTGALVKVEGIMNSSSTIWFWQRPSSVR